MSNSSKIEAIILKRSNFSEADKIITLFSRERGKTKVLAKGIRRLKSRRAPHLELFNHVILLLHHGKTFNQVVEAQVIDDFSAIKSHLNSSGLLFYLAEVIDKILPEDQPHQQIFTDLKNILGQPLNTDVVKRFVVQLLWELGYLPRGKYPKDGVTIFVESIVEKHINSKKFLEEI